MSCVRDVIHLKQFDIFPKLLLVTDPDVEILSGFEEDVSSIRDDHSTWVKADPASILERHLESIPFSVLHKIEDSRRPILSADLAAMYVSGHTSRSDSVSWAGFQGYEEEKKMSLIKNITSSTSAWWVTYMIHYDSYVIFFNKDTSFGHPSHSRFLQIPEMDSRQVVIEGKLGWILQVVISRASFRRLSRNGNYFIIMMSLPIKIHFSKKRDIDKVHTTMVEAYVDMITDDFSDGADRGLSDSDRRSIQ